MEKQPEAKDLCLGGLFWAPEPSLAVLKAHSWLCHSQDSLLEALRVVLGIKPAVSCCMISKIKPCVYYTFNDRVHGIHLVHGAENQLLGVTQVQAAVCGVQVIAQWARAPRRLTGAQLGPILGIAFLWSLKHCEE